MSASFVQESFLGGEWSPLAQGRMSDPSYKFGMSTCLNAYPLETGPWTRRPGSRFMAVTKAGRTGRIEPFNFTITKPYQIELTDGIIRFYDGEKLVRNGLGLGETSTIISISAATPAVVTFENALPVAWNNGDTIVFEQLNIPYSSPYLHNRQFVLRNKNAGAKTFTLEDPVTAASIDGSLVAYVAGAVKDKAHKVRELAAALYTAAKIPAVNFVSSVDEENKDNVLLLHPTIKPHFVYSYGQQSINPFDIAVRDFVDGPYMDVNRTPTLMGIFTDVGTGELRVVASSVVGINPTPGTNTGVGFLSTDVGRLIRIKSDVQTWSSTVSYKKGQLSVVSSIIYESLVDDNLNNNPSAAGTALWVQTTSRTQWHTVKITGIVSSTTVQVAPLNAAGISYSGALIFFKDWRLGLYSETTGWPSCGAYHEGRLWLSGPIGNRLDASKSNDYMNFSPADGQGNVADDSALALIANATDTNKIFWARSTDDGLMLGTQAGEWRVRSSVLDSPITPFTAQMRRVSTFGCADIPPASIRQTVFVQKQKRKLLAHMSSRDEFYFAENLTVTADHLTQGGITRIAWQQEPNLVLWALRADGKLLGCTYKKTQGVASQMTLQPIWNEGSAGWHQHTLGGGRVVESISTGPSSDGLSDTLYMITNDPATGVRHVEKIMPIFDDQQDDWANAYVDSGAAGEAVQEKRVAAGDSFDGLRIWGLYHLAGKTVVPVIGGLDCGDRTVSAAGYVDVAYSSDPEAKFTQAFLFAFDNGTDYAPYASNVSTNSAGVVTFPSNIGLNFTSRGQILRPDFENDAGPRNGPAFGKKRRLHQYAVELYRSRSIKFGSDFTNMYPIKLESAGGTTISAPALFNGIATDVISCDYDFKGQLAWECARPYPAVIVSLGGYISLADK